MSNPETLVRWGTVALLIFAVILGLLIGLYGPNGVKRRG